MPPFQTGDTTVWRTGNVAEILNNTTEPVHVLLFVGKKHDEEFYGRLAPLALLRSHRWTCIYNDAVPTGVIVPVNFTFGNLSNGAWDMIVVVLREIPVPRPTDDQLRSSILLEWYIVGIWA